MNIRELLIKIGVDAGGAAPAIDRVDAKAEKLKNTFRELNSIIRTFAAAATIKSILSMGDSMQSLQARIGASTGDIAGANAQLNDLAKHANDNRMDVEAYSDSWAKFNTGMARLGYQTSDTTKLVDGLSAAFGVLGTPAATAQGALFQLTQSISGGTVQMEELNSLADAAGPLYVSLAESIGGTVPAFKKMVSQGKVSSKMLADGIIKQTAKYIEQLRQMPMTLGNVWTIMLNDVKVGIGNLNASASAIPTVAKKIMQAWDWMRDKASALTDQLGGPKGLLIAIKDLLTPLALLYAGIYAFKTVAWLTTPIGLITALAAAIMLLYQDYKAYKSGAADTLIDWKAWKPEIDGAIKGIKLLMDALKTMTGQDNGIKALFEGIATYVGVTWSARMLASFTALFSNIDKAFLKTKFGLAIAGGLAASSWWDENIGNPADAKATSYNKNIKEGGWLDRNFGDTPLLRGNWTGAVSPDAVKTGGSGLPAANGGAVPRVTNNNTTNAPVNAPVTVNMTVNAAPGQSPEEIGANVQREFQLQAGDFWSRQMKQSVEDTYGNTP